MSDNTDRIMKDFEKAINELPPQAFWVLINVWQRRADVIPSSELESKIWNRAVKELKAACNAHRGDAIKALETLVTP